jgi:ribosomal-protein-alanine N-acetyltransferase
MMELEHSNSSAAHWPKRLYESVFADPERSPNFYRLAWVVEEREQTAAGFSVQASRIVAFLVARRVDSEWELENIVVSETFRRHGAALMLLAVLIAEARAHGGSEIFLEVRESNLSARALYQKAGFEKTDLRKDYYSDPREDAVVFRLSLLNTV